MKIIKIRFWKNLNHNFVKVLLISSFHVLSLRILIYKKLNINRRFNSPFFNYRFPFHRPPLKSIGWNCFKVALFYHLDHWPSNFSMALGFGLSLVLPIRPYFISSHEKPFGALSVHRRYKQREKLFGF